MVITAPDTKNPLSDPYLVNLVCSPSLLPGHMQPETAKGIFVHSEGQYYYNSPTLSAVMSNVFMLQCKKFAPKENMMEVARSCATPDIPSKDYSGGHLNQSLDGLPGHNLSSLYQRAMVVESVCCSNSGLMQLPVRVFVLETSNLVQMGAVMIISVDISLVKAIWILSLKDWDWALHWDAVRS